MYWGWVCGLNVLTKMRKRIGFGGMINLKQAFQFCILQTLLALTFVTIAASKEDVKFNAEKLNPAVFHDNRELELFTYSFLALAAEASKKKVGPKGDRANILFLMKDEAIEEKKIKLSTFNKLTDDEKAYLGQISLASDECSLEIPNQELAILVVDTKKVSNPEHVRVCIAYGIALILDINLTRPDSKTTWLQILTDLYMKLWNTRKGN